MDEKALTAHVHHLALFQIERQIRERIRTEKDQMIGVTGGFIERRVLTRDRRV